MSGIIKQSKTKDTYSLNHSDIEVYQVQRWTVWETTYEQTY